MRNNLKVWPDIRLILGQTCAIIRASKERRILMKNDLIYLDSYTLQQDMRIRLPKSVLANMNVEKGKTKLDIFFDKENNALVLIPKNKQEVYLEEDQ